MGRTRCQGIPSFREKYSELRRSSRSQNILFLITADTCTKVAEGGV